MQKKGMNCASTAPANSANGLVIPRGDFSHALKVAAKLIGNVPGFVCLSFGEGSLTIEAGGGASIVAARGNWPVPVFVGASWVRRMSKRLPPGDPVHLQVDVGRLCLNRYSEPCSLTADEHVITNELTETEEAESIGEAARILKKLRITPEALQELISKKYVNGPIAASAEEKRMLSLIAKAWIVLTPFGVGTEDLRQLVDDAVRNAWK